MASIQKFIQSAVADFGVSEGAAQSGVGAILGVLQGRADPNDFQQLLSAMPGAETLVSEAAGASGEEESSGGLLGGGLGAVGAMLGGDSGSALSVLNLLQSSGLSSEQLVPFVSKFVDFAKSSAGEALVRRILSQVPELAKFLG